MKEKFTMTTFFAAGLADIATTSYALENGFREVGPYGHRMLEMGNMDSAFIHRMAVTAVLIGLYAVSKERNSKFEFSFDKGLRIGNIYSWGIVALNTLYLAGYIK